MKWLLVVMSRCLKIVLGVIRDANNNISILFLLKTIGTAEIEPGEAGSGSKYANHCALLTTITFHPTLSGIGLF